MGRRKSRLGAWKAGYRAGKSLAGWAAKPSDRRFRPLSRSVQAAGYALGSALDASSGKPAGRRRAVRQVDAETVYWEQVELEEAREEQDDATKATENVLYDLGTYLPDVLSVESAKDVYAPHALQEPEWPSAGEVRSLASDDYVSPLWAMAIGGIAIGAAIYWDAGVLGRNIAGLAAVGALICIWYRQRKLRDVANFALGNLIRVHQSIYDLEADLARMLRRAFP